MEIYVIRHAEAVARGDNSTQSDADRPLTPAGEEQARAVAKGLRRKGAALQVLLTSPLLRARQTAEGIRKGWSGEAPEVQVCEELAPGYKPRKLARVLRELGRTPVGLVGHEPDLSAWVAWLIGSRKTQLALAKGGVAHVSCESDDPAKGKGTLVQLLTLDWLT